MSYCLQLLSSHEIFMRRNQQKWSILTLCIVPWTGQPQSKASTLASRLLLDVTLSHLVHTNNVVGIPTTSFLSNYMIILDQYFRQEKIMSHSMGPDHHYNHLLQRSPWYESTMKISPSYILCLST